MEYIIGVIVVAVVAVIYLFIKKVKAKHFAEMTTLDFQTWVATYLNSPESKQHLMAKNLIIETIRLAEPYKALTEGEAKAMMLNVHTKSPIHTVNMWINDAFDPVCDFFGANLRPDTQARMMGVFMLVVLIGRFKGFEPNTSLETFMVNFSAEFANKKL